MTKQQNNEILFTFNDTEKIKIGKNVHLQGKWKVESILVAAEETIKVIPFGTHICCINNQYYQFTQKPYKEGGATTVKIRHLRNYKKS